MKAKMYTNGAQMEVRVSNKFYTSTENEDKKSFLKRVKIELEKDFDEAIDIVEVSRETLEGYEDALLVEGFKTARGLQETIVKEILSSRGIEVEKIEKTSKQKVEMRNLEEMKASEEYVTAKSKVGQLAQYIPNKSEEVVKGVVKSISLNKTNTIIYFNIQCGTALRCCTAKNDTLQFFEF